jgi:ribosomal protein S18 acetylase RimI-like enzyme
LNTSNTRVDIIQITPSDATPAVVDALARCLAASEPDRLEDHRRFWETWFRDEIPGSKATVAAVLRKSENKPRNVGRLVEVVGLCRLWRTPYLEGRCFVEGLEVISEVRRRGKGTRLAQKCVDTAMQLGVPTLHAHIHDSNLASRRLFEKLGFIEIAHGYWSTYREWRERGSEYTLDLSNP